MDFRQLGQSGLTVSVVGLGCNNFGGRLDFERTAAVVAAALDEGITLFDTADIYGNRGGSESFLGELLKDRREEVVLATKFGMDMGQPLWGARGSRRYLRFAVEGSLRRLQTDWIDLYQLHQPDPKTPIEETLGALDELVQEGKVRYIGSSQLDGWQVADAEWVARSRRSARFISAQNHYNLLERGVEASLVPACLHYGIGILPFFPLASGLLTGKYRPGGDAPPGSRLAGRLDRIDPTTLAKVEALAAFAAQRGITLLDVAIGGLAARPAVASVIAGATRPEQVTANVAAGRWVPTAEDLAALDEVLGAA
ncbi:MAG TPA: aldo/keto reductase [Acidimicrobiales bacterium]|nr:aldo/keto reductase [Acidimicrobiales bacterium]